HRPAARLANDLDIRPAYALGPARAERLEHGFLGGKPSRQVLVAPRPIAGVRQLALGEHPFQEAVAKPLDRSAHALDLGQIDAVAQDHADSALGFLSVFLVSGFFSVFLSLLESGLLSLFVSGFGSDLVSGLSASLAFL